MTNTAKNLDQMDRLRTARDDVRDETNAAHDRRAMYAAVIATAVAEGNTPSPTAIEQFKKWDAAHTEALAKWEDYIEQIDRARETKANR